MMDFFNTILILLIHCHQVVVSQQYTIKLNSEVVSMSEILLPSCTSDTAAAVIFLDTSGEDNTDEGQGFVTVCLKKNSTYVWALVRDDNHTAEQIKLGALHAACRQNGYFGSPIRMSQSPTETLIDNSKVSYTVSYVNCPIVKNSGNGAQIFVRCALGEVNDGVDINQSYLYVQCKQSDAAYLGQVKLDGMNPNEYREVQLYYAVNELTQEWRYVCVKRDTADKIADSICRQLGFTNANMPKVYHQKDRVGKGWKIEGEIGPWCNCTDCSLPCFTQCWQNNISISGMDFCADDDDEDDDTYKYLRLMCEFNSDRAISISSGSQALCQYQRCINTTTCTCNSSEVTDCNTTVHNTTGQGIDPVSTGNLAVSGLSCLLTLIIILITSVILCLACKVPKIRRDQQNMEENQRNMREAIQRNIQENQRDMQEAVQRNIEENQRNMRENIEALEQNFQQEIRNVQQNLQLLQDIPQNVVELQQNVINLRASLQELQQNMQQGFQHNVEQIRRIVLNDGAN